MIETALKRAFAPEFLNRVDDVIVFNSLSKEDIFQIIDIELKSLLDRIQGLGYNVQLTDDAKEYIAERGFDPNFGARPLNRAIQKHLEDPIAEEILKGELQDGDVMEVGVDKEADEIKISILKEARKRKKKEEDNLS
ncbi:Chaperone protein ClpB [compost metagenome]